MTEDAIIREIRELRARVDQLWKAEGGGGAVGTETVFFTIEGVLAVVASPLKLYNISGTSKTISKVFLSVSDAPIGANLIVDVHKDGVTIFTNQAHRPTIVAGQTTGFTVDIDAAAWADGSYLEVVVDQIGSTVAGSNLVIHILYS